MIVNLVNRTFHTPDYVMETIYNRLIPNRGLVGDSLSRSQSTYEDYDFVEYALQFKSSDFDIQSILSLGAYDMLKPTYVASISSMSFADKFQDFPSPKKP